MQDTAEQFSARRGKRALLISLAAGCFAVVAMGNGFDHPGRAPLCATLWILWMGVTLAWVFGIPGGLRLSAADRAIVNDELARLHQAATARFGLAVAACGLIAFSICSFLRIDLPTWTVPAIATATIVCSGLFFSWLELRDG